MRLKTKSESAEIIDTIVSWFGGRLIELDYETPFQLLCAVILSAQATDKQVNRITPALFAMVREPEDMRKLTLDQLTGMLSNLNYYKTKAKYLYFSGLRIAEEFWGKIPDNLELIRTLPGVGIKTGKVVLSVLHDAPLVGVDTHIHRVCNRIGLVKTKTPEQTDKALVRRFNEKQLTVMHHPFVLFGRYHCTARSPKCTTCKVQEWCNYFESLKREDVTPYKTRPR